MNSAPVPGPSLRAATLPPCISTRDFTRASPRPSPTAPCFPASGSPPERVEHPRQAGRERSPAVVPNPQDNQPGLHRRGQPDVPARVGKLGRVGQQVRQHLLQPHGVGDKEHRLGRDRNRQLGALPRGEQRCVVVSLAPATTSARSTSSFQSGRPSQEPAQRSKRSSTSRTTRRAWWAAIVRVRRTAGSPSPECSSRARTMAASGSRNSWARVASPSVVGRGRRCRDSWQRRAFHRHLSIELVGVGHAPAGLLARAFHNSPATDGGMVWGPSPGEALRRGLPTGSLPGPTIERGDVSRARGMIAPAEVLPTRRPHGRGTHHGRRTGLPGRTGR